MIVLLVAGRRRAYWGWPWGPCGPGGQQSMLADWHQRAHAGQTEPPPGQA